MSPRQSFHLLLATVSLWGIASATPLPAVDQAISKRTPCLEITPVLTLGPSSSPFISCTDAGGTASFLYQTDANFVVYDASHVAVWASNTGGRTCTGNNCTLEFQADGNLVEYFNRVPIWYTGTGANIGQSLWLQTTPPYLYILNSAGGVAWQS